MMKRGLVALLVCVSGCRLVAQEGTAAKSAPAGTAASQQIADSKPILHVGVSVHPPVISHQVEPEYPSEASRKKLSGSVEVGLIVDENGLPQKVFVARGAGHGMDEAAVDAVKQYRFKPATLGDRPIAVRIYIDVSFQIFK